MKKEFDYIEFDALKRWLELTQEKLNLPLFTKWTNAEYTVISEAVFEETRTLISRNTFKNIVSNLTNNKNNYLPRASTRDILAQFHGFSTWNEFVNSLNFANKNALPIRHKNNLRKNFIVGIGILLIILLAVVVKNNRPVKKATVTEEYCQYKIDFSDTIGLAPHTFTLNYDFTSCPYKTAEIDFDSYSAKAKYETRNFTNKKGLFNLCYYWPGRYEIYSIIDSTVVNRQNIYILSNGWDARVYNAVNTNHETPWFLKFKRRYNWPKFKDFNQRITDTFIKNGQMHVSKEQALAKQDISENYYTEFSNYQLYNISGDNFTFDMQFFNSSFGKENFCYEAKVELIGTKKKHFLQIVQPGCKVYAQHTFSENVNFAYDKILEGFELNFLNSSNLRIENNNKQVKVYFNEHLFLETRYKRDIDDLVGIIIRLKSAGTVENVSIKDNSTGISFSDDFNR